MKKIVIILLFLCACICQAEEPTQLDLTMADVSAGTVFGAGYEAYNAFDMDFSGTRWAGDGSGSSNWIMVDLGDVYSLSEIIIDYQAAWGRDFQILTSIAEPNMDSLNLEEWKVAAEVDNLGQPGDESSINPEFTDDAIINFDSGTVGSETVTSIGPNTVGNAAGRYLCIYMTESGAYGMFSIWEVKVFARSTENFAGLVSPEDGAEDLGLSTTLEWTAGSDSSITGHYVYLGDEIDNLTLETPTALPVETTTYQPNSLDQSTTYYWRVEEKVGSNSAGDPNNNYKGFTWSFSTKRVFAYIDNQPEDIYAFTGEDAVFDVNATDPNGGELNYQWYYDADANSGGEIMLSDGADYSGTATKELTIHEADSDDIGYYFCRVTNYAGPFDTDKAKLTVADKELLAHWTFNWEDFTPDVGFDDVTGNGNTANVAAAEFVEGIVDGDGDLSNRVSSGAVNIDDINDTADVGTFNPIENTRQLTVSAWINFRPHQAGIVPMIVSKRDGFSSTDDNMFHFHVSDDWQVALGAYGEFVASDIVEEVLLPYRWVHVAATAIDNGQAYLYVNGERVASSSDFDFADDADSTFYIGRIGEDPRERFGGYLDDIKVYNYALSYEQIVDIYNAESSGTVCVNQPEFDVNNDCLLNFEDFAEFADDWASDGWYPYQP